MRLLRSSILVKLQNTSSILNKDQLNKGTKNYIACKLCTTNLRSSKNYILQTKALMWNEGFPGNFFLRIKPNAHTPKACKARTTYSY